MRINTAFQDMVEEIRPQISTNIEYLSGEVTPRTVPNITSEFSLAPKHNVDTMKNGWLELDAKNEDLLGETRPRRIMNSGEHVLAECYISPEISVNILPGTFSMTNDTGYILENEKLRVYIKAEDLVNELYQKVLQIWRIF